MAAQPAVALVTDSYACCSALVTGAGGPAVLAPNVLTIGGRSYREGVDIGSEESVRLLRDHPREAALRPPSAAEYAELYAGLARQASAIISIHASREISESWANARAGALQVGHCPITVIDSRTLSAGQALLVMAARRMINQGRSADNIVRALRSATEQVYSIFYVENTAALFANRVLEPAHAILSAMIGVRPVLTVENGRLTAMEKVKTRAQAVERLVEYAVEFGNGVDGVLLQPKVQATELTRQLLERLATEVPGHRFQTAACSGSLAMLLGTDVMGIVILDEEMDGDSWPQK
jgi:DegV family protein with EDD domain